MRFKIRAISGSSRKKYRRWFGKLCLYHEFLPQSSRWSETRNSNNIADFRFKRDLFCKTFFHPQYLNKTTHNHPQNNLRFSHLSA